MSPSVRKGLILVGVIALTATASAEGLALPSLDAATAKVTEWFGIIMIGLAMMWGYRKITTTTNKT